MARLVPISTGPRLVPITAPQEDLDRLRAATVAADREAMTHKPLPPVAPTAEWSDVLAALPRQAKGSAINVIASLGRGEVEKLRKSFGDTPTLMRAGEEAAAVAREAQADMAPVPDSNWVQRGVQQAVGSVPHLAIPAGVAVATRSPVAAALAMYPSTAAQKEWELRDQGQPAGQAKLHAAAQGVVEVATEFPAFNFLLKAGGGAIKQLVGFLLRDLPGESVAQLAQGTDDYVAAAQRAGQPVTPEVVATGMAEAAKQLPETWVATAILGVVQGGPVVAANQARGREIPLDRSGIQAVAERGVSASRGRLVPITQTPDTRTPPITPEQHFIGNRLVPGTGGFLTGGYEIAEPAAEAPAKPAPEPVAVARPLERIATDPDLRSSFEALRGETGWDTKGGEVIRDVGTGEVTGRTQWLPRYPWFKDKPDFAGEAMIKRVIDKVVAGKKLGSREQQLATWLAEVAADRIAGAPYVPPSDVLSGAGLEDNGADANETALVARAAEIDEAVVERLAVQYENDDDGFLRAVRDFLDTQAAPTLERSAGSVTQEARAPAAINRDLFAGSDTESESIARRNAVEQERLRREGKLTGDVPVETGDPTDLFSQSRQQTDLTDAPTNDGVQTMRSGAVNRSWAPGIAWTPSYQIQGQPNVGAPAQPQTVTIGTRAADERTLQVPDEPIRREHIMDEFQRAFRVKVYQGKPFRLRKALGFFDPKSFEVRVKGHNDLEVTSHEVFHWLDRTYPTIRALYHQPRFRDQLKSVSYDQKAVIEGFAEFGRLYMTQEPQAASRTPEFYDAFVAETKRLGIYDKLRRVQDRMHQWYMQGAELRATSKIGESPPPIRDRVEAWRQDLLERSQSRIIDYLHRAKTIERETAGSVGEDAAQSLYKDLRLLDHSRSVAHAVLNYGTPTWTARGDLTFSGKGLRQIFEPVADAMDETMAYFVGRRAEELTRAGKERLFTRDEVQALINKGLQSPKSAEIQRAFAEYQAFNERMLDFAVQSGIVSNDTRKLWLKMYNAYVPFYRIRDTLASGAPGKGGGLFKRLTGGTENLADTWDNIVRNAEMITEASLRNVAKRKLYRGIARSPLGQRYAVAIPTSVKPVNIGMAQIESALGQLIKDAAVKANDPNASAGDRAHWAQVAMALDLLTGASNMAGTGGELQTLSDQATFYLRGQKPTILDKDFYLSAGKPVWFQIGDQELMRMLEAINSYRPLHIVEKAFGVSARVLRRGVTLAPEFQIRNFLRDQMNAATLSEGGQKPFIDGLGAMRDVLTNDETLKLFFLNGGGFGLQQAESGRALKLELERVRKANGDVNIRAILDTPAKVFEWYDKATQASELATRVAEFKKIREQGKSLREAAYQANEVSTDFAAHGSDPALSFVRLAVPFFGARLQGLARLGREMHEHPVRLAARALLMITLPSLLLYWRNKDDERYKALSPETKALYWVLLDPQGDGVWLVPKPFEVGALFGTVPEIAWDQVENQNDKRTVDALKFMVANTFSFNPIPQAIKPVTDLARNKDFRGAPIIPEGLKGVDPTEQFTAYTSESMRNVGELLGVSPIKLEYLLRGYLGTLGTYAVSAADALVKPDASIGRRPAKRMSERPVVRAFRREEPYRSTAYEQDFYDMLEQSRRVVATANHMRKTLRIEDQAAYTERNEATYGRKDVLNRIKARADEINESMKVIRFNPDLSAAEKRQQIDELQREKNRLFREVAAAFGETP